MNWNLVIFAVGSQRLIATNAAPLQWACYCNYGYLFFSLRQLPTIGALGIVWQGGLFSQSGQECPAKCLRFPGLNWSHGLKLPPLFFDKQNLQFLHARQKKGSVKRWSCEIGEMPTKDKEKQNKFNRRHWVVLAHHLQVFFLWRHWFRQDLPRYS